MRGESGLSLVELMVAMAISLILLAGVYRLFISSTTSYREQDDLARLQENVRAAMDVLAPRGPHGRLPALHDRRDGLRHGAACAVDAAFDTTATDTFTPVTIVQGAAVNGSDTVTVRYKDAAASACTQVIFSVNPAAAATNPAVFLQNTRVGLAAATGDQPVVDGVESMQALLRGGHQRRRQRRRLLHDAPGRRQPDRGAHPAADAHHRGVAEADLDTATYDVTVGDSGAPPCPVAEPATTFDPVDDRRARRIFTTTLTLRNQLQ